MSVLVDDCSYVFCVTELMNSKVHVNATHLIMIHNTINTRIKQTVLIADRSTYSSS